MWFWYNIKLFLELLWICGAKSYLTQFSFISSYQPRAIRSWIIHDIKIIQLMTPSTFLNGINARRWVARRRKSLFFLYGHQTGWKKLKTHSLPLNRSFSPFILACSCASSLQYVCNSSFTIKKEAEWKYSECVKILVGRSHDLRALVFFFILFNSRKILHEHMLVIYNIYERLFFVVAAYF